MPNLKDCLEPESDSGLAQDVLFRKLQLLALEKQKLDDKMHDWETSYQALREVEDSLVAAYGLLSIE